MHCDLRLFNPSPYRRNGPFVVPWEPIEAKTGIKPDEFTLEDEMGKPVPLQIDSLGPQGSGGTVLSFRVPAGVPPGRDDYAYPTASLSVRRQSREGRVAETGVCVPVEAQGRVELWNSLVFVSISLCSKKPDIEEPFGGALQSVRLKGYEMLDAWRAQLGWKNHTPSKRLQLEKIVVGDSANPALLCEVPISEQCHEMIASCAGPIRASVQIASRPFPYGEPKSTALTELQPKYGLHRIITLFAGADYIVEELSLHPTAGSDTVPPTFSPRFIIDMDAGPAPAVYRPTPAWFALGSPGGDKLDLHPGYGFAADSQICGSTYPAWLGGEDVRKFAWELFPSRAIKCVHMFMWGNPGGFDERIGHKWYEEIYRPLRAEI